MKTINFGYEEGNSAETHYLSYITNGGVSIIVFFDRTEAITLITNGVEMVLATDDHKNLLVDIGTTFAPDIIPLQTIVEAASEQIQDYLSDHKIELQNQKRHEDSFRSPR